MSPSFTLISSETTYASHFFLVQFTVVTPQATQAQYYHLVIFIIWYNIANHNILLALNMKYSQWLGQNV